MIDETSRLVPGCLNQQSKIMETKFINLLIRVLGRNLSLSEWGCQTCKEETEKIVSLINQRKKVVIVLDPAFNVSACFESYHISCKEF